MGKVAFRRGSIWSDVSFCRFTLIGSLHALAMGIIIAVLPLLVSERFGSGDALIVTDVFLILTRVAIAPIVVGFLLKKGPIRVARLALVGLAGTFMVQALMEDYFLFQGTIVLRGVIGVACAGSLLTLQGWVIPKGKNVAANGVYLAATRSLFFLSPFFVKLGEGYCSTVHYFYIGSGLFLISACLTFSLSSCAVEGERGGGKEVFSYGALFRLFKKKPVLIKLFAPLFGFSVIGRALPLFLLWSTLGTFGLGKTVFISLLTAKGLGSVFASFISPILVRKITKKVHVGRFYFIMRLAAILCLLPLGWMSSVYGMMGWLVFSTLPSTLASLCFFTLLQGHLTKKEQGIVHTLTLPLSFSFGLVGTFLSFTYTHHLLSLQSLWLLIGGVSLAIGLVPLYQRQKTTPDCMDL